jgi:hypothetical protein
MPIDSLEIVRYDEASGTFPSTLSNMSPQPLPYSHGAGETITAAYDLSGKPLG